MKTYFLNKNDMLERFNLPAGEYGDYCIPVKESKLFLEKLKMRMIHLGYQVIKVCTINSDTDEQTEQDEIQVLKEMGYA